MKHSDVLIRRKTNVDLLDPRIKEALEDASKSSVSIPVYYQELQDMNGAKLIEDKTMCFAIAQNIHENMEGDLVADVITNDALALTENFQGVIDNFCIAVESKVGHKGDITLKPVLKQFIIYDKQKKAEIDAFRQRKISSNPMRGDVPEPSDITAEDVKDAVEEIADELAKELGVGNPIGIIPDEELGKEPVDIVEEEV